jgi:hypothetical protein
MVIGIPKGRLSRVAAVSVVLLIVAATAFVLWPVGNKPHPVYERALHKAQSHTVVQELLGGEINGSTPDKAVTTANTAQFEFYVDGEYGVANVLAEGKRSDGEWKVTSLRLEAPDGSVQDLLR